MSSKNLQDSLPQRNFRTNRRTNAKQQEFDGTENELTSTALPDVYSGNNSPGYGGAAVGGFGNNGFQPGLSFLPPPLMMMMMMRNAALGGGLMGPDGIDMVTVQRVLQAVMKVLQEVEQEKRAGGANPGVSSAMRLRS